MNKAKITKILDLYYKSSVTGESDGVRELLELKELVEQEIKYKHKEW